MLASDFSLLAPAVILLLSAFVLSIVIPRLPGQWQTHRAIQYFSAPGLVGLAGLLLLGHRLTAGEATTGDGLALSGWNFSAEGTGAALSIQADELSLPFLGLSILILLVVMLAALPLEKGNRQGWVLTLGASAYFLFISANSLTIAYAVLACDLLCAVYWLARKHSHLSVARLFLGILTASALMLQTSLTAIQIEPGIFLGLTLWLRLGLFPFVEATAEAKQTRATNNTPALAYWGLSLAVGIYLTISVAKPVPEVIRWLVVITVLLNGLLIWLTNTPLQQRFVLLPRLALTLGLFPLLFVAQLPEDLATAYTVGLILSMAALWVTTPLLGQPRFNEPSPKNEGFRAAEIVQYWPYLPAGLATFTLLGLPLSLSWPAWTIIYPALYASENIIFIITILALTLALSGLARYWLIWWRGTNKASTETAQNITIATFVAAVPFLIPGLAPWLISTIMSGIAPANSGQTGYALVTIAVTAGGALGLGTFRFQIFTWLRFSPATLVEFLQLRWLLLWVEKSLSQLGKLGLRVNVILEGQHYIGWALFTALVGSLIIILQM